MIRDEVEYGQAVQQIEAAAQRIIEHQDRLRSAGLPEVEIKRVIDPLRSFHLQLKEEVEEYVRHHS